MLQPSLSKHWSKIVGDGIEFIRNIDNNIFLSSETNNAENDSLRSLSTTMAPLLKSVFDMWRELNLYFVNEKLVLDSSRSYYSLHSLTYIQKIDFEDVGEASISFRNYLHMVCKIIERESGMFFCTTRIDYR